MARVQPERFHTLSVEMDLHKEQRVETLSQQSALVPERGRDILAVLYVLLSDSKRA